MRKCLLAALMAAAMFAAVSPAASVAGGSKKTHFCPPGTQLSAYCACPPGHNSAYCECLHGTEVSAYWGGNKGSANWGGNNGAAYCECLSGASMTGPGHPATLFVDGSTVFGSTAYKTIGAAVAAASAGSQIIVCPGVYPEDVTVSKPLTIVGINAVIDATNLNNGFMIGTAGAGSRIQGFTIENAVGEGILAMNTSNVSIVDNVIDGNDKGMPPAKSTYAQCSGPNADCGEGVHLWSTTNSQVVGNTIRGNSGGVLLTDETGPTDGNLISHNTVEDNVDDCGITLAGHNPLAAPGGVPNPAVGGIFNNVISHNVAVGNGTAPPPAQGAGILIATPLSGGAVYNNTISANFIRGNGLSGVTVHGHTSGEDLNGNQIIDNVIATNNVSGDPDFSPVVDPSTTGVFVGTASPLTITIEHNVIYANTNGIFLTGPGLINTTQIDHNLFFGVTNTVVGP